MEDKVYLDISIKIKYIIIYESTESKRLRTHIYISTKNITFSDIRPQNAGIDKNGNFGFLDLIIHDYNSGKDVRIKPSKRGTFTKAAKQHGMSVRGFANRVLRNPSKYSAAMRKKANFARNASKWNK